MAAVRHIALIVPDLRAAENFYQHVFTMQLLMREAVLDDNQWYSLPLDKGWGNAEAAGFELSMVALKRDAFVLALFQEKPDPAATMLEIGISMTAESTSAVRDRLPRTVQLVNHDYGDHMFVDPFGYRWHLWPAGQPFQSNGETAGRWLEV